MNATHLVSKSSLAGLVAAAVMAAASLVAGPPSLRPHPGSAPQDRYQPRPHQPVVQRIIVEPDPPPPPLIVVQPSRIDVDVWTDSRSYFIGEDVRVNFRTDQDAFVYVFSTDPRGRTNLIFPNAFDQDNFMRAHRTYSLPDRGYRFVADGPPGPDTITVVATTECYDWIRSDFGPDCFRHEQFPTVHYAPTQFYQRVEQSAHLSIQSHNTRINVDVRTGHPARAIRVEPDYCPPSHGQASTTVQIREHWGRPPIHVEYRDDCEPARLRLTVSHHHAEIFIDGQYVGRGSIDVELPPGRYEVVARARGYDTWRRHVNLREGESERYSIRLRRD
jgi:hypothetical protein